MNLEKSKKRFIDKLLKKKKKDLVELICDQHEETYFLEKKIENLQSLVISHQQVIRSVLDNQSVKFIYELSEDDKLEELDKTKKESIKSYA